MWECVGQEQGLGWGCRGPGEGELPRGCPGVQVEDWEGMQGACGAGVVGVLGGRGAVWGHSVWDVAQGVTEDLEEGYEGVGQTEKGMSGGCM